MSSLDSHSTCVNCVFISASFFNLSFDYTSITYIHIEDLLTMIKHEYKPLFQTLNDGDLIDFESYRGIGLFYLHHDVFIKTLGEYGYFLPTMAWKFVIKYGIDYYANCGAEFILIPIDADVIRCDELNLFLPTKVNRNPFDFGISINNQCTEDGFVIINGIKYNRDIQEFW